MLPYRTIPSPEEPNLDWDSAPPSSKSPIVGIEGMLGSDSVVVVSHLAYLD